MNKTIQHAEPTTYKQLEFAVDVHDIIHELKHYLPAQAPLKDFIHHNTLHAFQHLKFSTAIEHASTMFGYNVALSLKEYRALMDAGRISEQVLNRIIIDRKGKDNLHTWRQKLLFTEYRHESPPRIGSLRAWWKKAYRIDMDSMVHPTLFRVLCSYLDQGIAIWNFPVWHKGFLGSLREIERNSFTSFFRTSRARNLLLQERVDLKHLLSLVVGDEKLYKQYLFDQQFAHQGWSGMVSTVEDHPNMLLDRKHITLIEVIIFELLLEIDTLEYQFGTDWVPLSSVAGKTVDLFEDIPSSETREVLILWQEAFEWTYYDDVAAALQLAPRPAEGGMKSFQSIFCIDDRESSLRRHIEQIDPHAETFGTAGFFGVEFFFKPEHGKFYTKLCPAPITPKYLIKELETKITRAKDLHFTKHSHTLFSGWIISQTLGFWAAFKLFLSIFKPAVTPTTATSFSHMDKDCSLTIENRGLRHRENDLQVGFTVPEMVQRVEGVLKSIGLVRDFAPMVYVVGHGSSSINNPHYAAYDCGACSGRPGSVNARVFAFMANHAEVREILRSRGLNIPVRTEFVGALHDTARDEITFYDEASISRENRNLHATNVQTFIQVLKVNAKERSRRFDSINTKEPVESVYKKVKLRSVLLFEPRPELNHATNSLCIVGRRALTRNVFLDRRSFLNSYDYRLDPDGTFLGGILNAVAPVCGGINLEYFFSRVDNQKLGAGTKLPHNVMGLFGVANGIEGDLRPGLPSQMIEVHDPLRLMMVVEHFPDVVLHTIRGNPATFEWFMNEWIHLLAIDPETRELFVFCDNSFKPYQPLRKEIPFGDVNALIESTGENLPVVLIN